MRPPQPSTRRWALARLSPAGATVLRQLRALMADQNIFAPGRQPFSVSFRRWGSTPIVRIGHVSLGPKLLDVAEAPFCELSAADATLLLQAPRRPGDDRDHYYINEPVAAALLALHEDIGPPPPIARPRAAKPGRPRGRTHSRETLVNTFREIAKSHRPTHEELGERLDPPVSARTVSTYLKEYRLPWPIE